MQGSELSNVSMDASGEFKPVVGSNIHFKTYDGEYKGIVKRVSFETKQVTVEHVYSLPQNVYFGNSTFFFYEFLTYNILNKFKSDLKVDKKEVSFNSKLKNLKSNHLTNVSTKEHEEQFAAEEDSNLTEFLLKLPPNLQHLLPNDSVILNSVDLEFQSATSHISKQSVIGVSFHGSKISRIGKLIWVCISTKYCAFLFDIQALGREAFDNGLRDVLQNGNIVKVIHDCRRPSDCLTCLFSTTLANVFDTQVAELIVRKQRAGSDSSFINVIDLDECLENYLSVPKEFLFTDKKLLPCVQSNYFSNRPINSLGRNILIKDTLYLLILREKLTKMMLSSVYKASDLYLKAIASSPDLTLTSSVPSIVPPSLLIHGIEIMTFRKDSVEGRTSFDKNKIKRSSPKTDIDEGDRKITQQNSDFCLYKNVSKGKREKELTRDVDIQTTSDTLANDIAQKCSFTRKKFICDKISNSGLLKTPLNKTYGKKFRNSVVVPSDLISEASISKAYLNRNEGSKSLMNSTNVVKAKMGSKAKLGMNDSTNESRIMNGLASNITNDSVFDYSDTWTKLRLAPDMPVSDLKKNFKIVPSGMGC